MLKMTPLRINSLTSLLLRLSAKICIFVDVMKGLQSGAAVCRLNVPRFFHNRFPNESGVY